MKNSTAIEMPHHSMWRDTPAGRAFSGELRRNGKKYAIVDCLVNSTAGEITAIVDLTTRRGSFSATTTSASLDFTSARRWMRERLSEWLAPT